MPDNVQTPETPAISQVPVTPPQSAGVSAANYIDSQQQPTNQNVTPTSPQNMGKFAADYIDSQTQSQAEAHLAGMQYTDPSQHAKAYSIGNQVGLPASAISPALDTFQKQVQLDKNRQIVQQNPAMANFVNNHPDAAAVAQNDFDGLNVLNKIAATLVTQVGEPVEEAKLQRIRNDTLNPETSEELKETQQEVEKYQSLQPTGTYAEVGAGINAATSIFDNFVHALPVAAAGAVAGALAGLPAGGVGAIPGAIIGGIVGLKTGMAADMGRTASGATLLYLDKIRDSNGQPLTEAQKRVGATIAGAMTFGIAEITLPWQGKAAQEAISSFVADAIKQAMTRPTVVSALGNFAKKTAVGAGEGAFMMGSMALAQQFGQEISKQIAPGQWSTVANDPALRKQYASQLGDAIENGALLVGTLHGVGGAIGEYGNYINSKQAQETFQNLLDGSEKSETRKLSPDAFQTFMQSHTEGKPIENVYISADKISKLYAKAKIDPGADDGLFGKAVPDIAQQLEQAKDRNGDIVIPTANYTAHIAGTAMDKALRNDLRPGENIMSINETLEKQKEYADIFSKAGEEFKNQLKQNEPIRQVQDEAMQQALDAGLKKPEANAYATLTAQHANVRGIQQGISPLEAHRQGGIYIRKGVTGEAKTAPLEAFPATKASNEITLDDLEKQHREAIKGENRPISDVLDYLKNPPKRPPKGNETLSEFLKRKGGLKLDEQGELKGRDVNKTIKGLVTRKGMYIDDAAKLAWEAGFFPDDKENRPSENDFLELLDRELSGQKVKRVGEEALTEKEQLYNSAGDLIKILDDYGIKFEGKDNAAILQEMEDNGLLSGDKVREFEQQSLSAEDKETLEKNDKELRKLDYDGMVNWLVEKAPDDYTKEVATAVQKKAEQLKKAGASFDFKVVDQDKQLTGSANGKSILKTASLGKSTRNEILVNGAQSGERNGVNYKTLLHEALHSVTQAEIDHAPKSEPVKALRELYNDVVKEFNSRAKNGTLNDFEKKIHSRENNALVSPDELLTWGLTDKNMQEWLASVKVSPKETLFTKFVDIFKKLFGLKDGTALERLLSVSDNLLHSDLSEAVKEANAQNLSLGKQENTTGHPDWSLQRGHTPVFAEGNLALYKAKSMLGKDIYVPGKNIDDKGVMARVDVNSYTGKDFTPEELKALKDKASELSSTTLNQRGEAPRGSVTITPDGRQIITLFEKADKTTLFHELGHIWLNQLQHDALSEDAPEELKQDWETVRKYIGHDKGAIQTEAHETFARSFEQYLMEGKAPSNALLRVFRNFKDWFTKVYSTVKALNVPLNDDIRQVFDRMLATDDEISQIEKKEQVDSLFKTKDEAGMTDAEFKAYNETALKAAGEAREQLLHEALADIRKKNTAEYKKAVKEIKPDIEKAVDAQPDIKALNYFKTGKIEGTEEVTKDWPKMEIGATDLENMYPDNPNVKEELPKAVRDSVFEKGESPDNIAPFLGYADGKAMMDDLLNLGKQEARAGDKPVRDYIVDQKIQEAMKDKFGLSDEELHNRAMEKVNSADRMDLKLAELRAIARKSGQVSGFTKENIAKWASEQVGEMKVKDAGNTFQFVRSAGKAGRDAIKAISKGDYDAAFTALQQQLLNMEMVKQAKAIQANYVSGMKTFKYAAENPTIKSTAQEYLNHVHNLLNQFGFKVKRDTEELKNSLAGKSLLQFALDKRGAGRDIEVPDYLFQDKKPNFANLTTDQFAGLKDAVNSLLHNGREEKTLIIGGKRIQKDLIINSMLDELSKFDEKTKSEYLNQKDAPSLEKNLNRFTSVLRSADSVLVKPEQLFDWIDKNNILGPMNNYILRPLKDAQFKKADLIAKSQEGFRKLAETLPEGWSKSLSDKVANDKLLDPSTGKPYLMTRERLLSIMLNTGNESNLKKLTDGYKWKIPDVQDLIHQNATKADWDYVQHVWNSFESLWPQIEDLHRRTTGIAPTKIKPTPINTEFGKYAGGYFPVVYDKELSRKTAGKALMTDKDVIFDKDYYRATTSKGHTISRVENFSDMLSTDLSIIPQKINQAIHDLAYREAITSADSLISDAKFQAALTNTWGKEYAEQLRPWLKDIANQPNSDMRPINFMENVARYSRLAANEMGVGFRLTTSIKHGLSAASNSAGEIGLSALKEGTQEFYSAPSAKKDFIFSKSGEMRTRAANLDRDIREDLKNLLGENTTIQQMRRFGHAAIANLDMASAMPTWLGAYRKGLREGMKEDDAVFYADKSVRNAHGSQNVMDLAAIQRGSEYQKAFTMFYGFMNHMYNRTRDIGHRINQGDVDMPVVLGKTLAYVAAPALVSSIVSGEKKKEDENWFGYAANAVGSEMAGLFPLARDGYRMIEYGLHEGVLESPMGRMMESVASTAKDIKHEIEGDNVSKKWLQHAIETPGYMFALPLGQIAQSAQYLWDISDGNENPEDLQEFLHGIMYGKGK